MTKTQITEADLVWYILSERYDIMCWKMIDDMFSNRISYKKLDAYMELIMKHVPFEPALQIFVTWARNMPIDTSKMKHFDIWHPMYGPAIIERNSRNNRSTPKLNGYVRS